MRGVAANIDRWGPQYQEFLRSIESADIPEGVTTADLDVHFEAPEPTLLDKFTGGVMRRAEPANPLAALDEEMRFSGLPSEMQTKLRTALRNRIEGKETPLDEARSAIPTPVSERALWRGGEAVSDWAEETFPAGEGYEESLGREVGAGLGSLGVGLAASVVGGPVAGPIVGGALFSAMGAGEAADRAVQAGATDEDIVRAAAMGLGAGATDTLPAEMLLRRLPLPGVPIIAEAVKRFGGERVVRAIGRIGMQATVEAAQEGGQQALQNLIAREVHSPETVIMEGVEGGAGVGGIVGGVAGLAREGLTGFGRRRGQGTAPTPELSVKPLDRRATRTGGGGTGAPARPAPAPLQPQPADIQIERWRCASGRPPDMSVSRETRAPPSDADTFAINQSQLWKAENEQRRQFNVDMDNRQAEYDAQVETDPAKIGAYWDRGNSLLAEEASRAGAFTRDREVDSARHRAPAPVSAPLSEPLAPGSIAGPTSPQAGEPDDAPPDMGVSRGTQPAPPKEPAIDQADLVERFQNFRNRVDRERSKMEDAAGAPIQVEIDQITASASDLPAGHPDRLKAAKTIKKLYDHKEGAIEAARKQYLAKPEIGQTYGQLNAEAKALTGEGISALVASSEDAARVSRGTRAAPPTEPAPAVKDAKQREKTLAEKTRAMIADAEAAQEAEREARNVALATSSPVAGLSEADLDDVKDALTRWDEVLPPREGPVSIVQGLSEGQLGASGSLVGDAIAVKAAMTRVLREAKQGVQHGVAPPTQGSSLDDMPVNDLGNISATIIENAAVQCT